MFEWVLTLAISLGYPIVIALVALGLAVVLRRWVRPVFTFFVVCVVVAVVAVRLPHLPIKEKCDGCLRVLSFNAYVRDNAREAKVDAAIAAGVDVLLVVEGRGAWVHTLAKYREEYPYVALFEAGKREVREVYTDYFVVMSKLPFKLEEPLAHHAIPVDFGGFRVLMMHPMSPVSPELLRVRNELLQGGLKVADDKPLIVAGDFNAVWWDDALVDFADGLGVKRFGVPFGTYIWFLPLIPIDYVFGRGGVSAEMVRTVPVVGSDHLGILSDWRIDGLGD